MKSIYIALKDMKRSFRSLFALAFMFGVPLAVTSMFYLMFGNIAADDGFDLPRIKVVIANLDIPPSWINQDLSGSDQPWGDAKGAGQMIVETLQSDDFVNLLEVTTVPDAAAARRAVDSRQAGVAIIIPEHFSVALLSRLSSDDQGGSPKDVAEIEIYQDPTITLGPGIVRSVLSQFTDGFSGIQIALRLALQQAEAGQLEYAQIGQIVQEYIRSAIPQEGDPAQAWLEVRSPAAFEENNPLRRIIGPIMGGMMIFYAFFTGMSAAQTILQEDENGTLPRLFTTPTSQQAILGGKFLAVGLTVLVQITVLLIAAWLIFRIVWGAWLAVVLFTFATAAAATTFGIFFNSLLKHTRQAGVLFGGVLTVTGMVGMMDVFTGNVGGNQLGILPLLTPQGWAVRSLLKSMNGASATEVLPLALVLCAMSTVFFAVGVWRFRKRYA